MRFAIKWFFNFTNSIAYEKVKLNTAESNNYFSFFTIIITLVEILNIKNLIWVFELAKAFEIKVLLFVKFSKNICISAIQRNIWIFRIFGERPITWVEYTSGRYPVSLIACPRHDIFFLVQDLQVHTQEASRVDCGCSIHLPLLSSCGASPIQPYTCSIRWD